MFLPPLPSSWPCKTMPMKTTDTSSELQCHHIHRPLSLEPKWENRLPASGPRRATRGRPRRPRRRSPCTRYATSSLSPLAVKILLSHLTSHFSLLSSLLLSPCLSDRIQPHTTADNHTSRKPTQLPQPGSCESSSLAFASSMDGWMDGLGKVSRRGLQPINHDTGGMGGVDPRRFVRAKSNSKK